MLSRTRVTWFTILGPAKSYWTQSPDVAARAGIHKAHAADAKTEAFCQSAVQLRRVQNAVQRRLIEEFLARQS